VLFCGGLEPAEAASFGKNNVQYTHFRWKYLTTEHFDIYYNHGGRQVADFVAEVAEEAYRELAQRFSYTSETDEPIILITYQSHNDFEQTNVNIGTTDESTGGFTEFLKTRVVVPFEGDHEKFRHVIHHELTHAVMLNMLYGQGFGAIVSGLSQARIPLWFIEGLSEHESHGWLDPETEMILRDAVVNDFLPEINQLGEYGYLGVYKCGQSILYWIAWRYGEEKIGEILHQVKRLHDFDRALKASIGLDYKELSKRWRRFLQERYWPQVAEMSPPDRIAHQLTDHEKEFCYVNNSPALSPNGEWLAFLSDRTDYFDIYLMNTLDGRVVRRLVRGQRTGRFEELHWLRPGITWSPDGTRIALCAKAGEMDALYIIEAVSGKMLKTMSFESDALFSPSWSPVGERVALVRVLGGHSDIAIVNLNTDRLELVTDDLYDDADPSWSPDGEKLLFTSNRGAELGEDYTPGKTLFGYPYDEFDVYEIDLETRELNRLTDDRFVERTPLWTPIENTILYVSNRSGVYNIYLHNLKSGESHSITNMVTGTFQPSIAWNSRALAFTTYFNNGYDIYMLNDPFSELQQVAALEIQEPEKIVPSEENASQLSLGAADYSHFVFNRLFDEPEEVEEEPEDTTTAVVRSRSEDGSYPSEDYRARLTPDMILVNASYDPYFLMQGSGLIMFTDVLGNHQIYVTADLNRSTEYSNLFFMYQYLARRVDIGGGFYHYAYPFYGTITDWLDRNWAFFLMGSYPLNRFNRIEFGTEWMVVERSVLGSFLDPWPKGSRLETLLPHLGYVHDTSVWRSYTEPTNGGRWRVDGSWGPGIGFTTLSFDWRRYFVYRKDYTFAFRLSGAGSQGDNPQRFFVGGMMNWINPRFDNPEDGLLLDDIQDIYFSSFITPLRGVGYYRHSGTRYILSNFEFRFPFIKHLMFGWPLPIYLRNVRGALFYDLGTAWVPRDLGSQLIPDQGNWSSGFGFGVRLIVLGLFPFEWDLAWSPEENYRPRHYLSLNFGF